MVAPVVLAARVEQGPPVRAVPVAPAVTEAPAEQALQAY